MYMHKTADRKIPPATQNICMLGLIFSGKVSTIAASYFYASRPPVMNIEYIQEINKKKKNWDVSLFLKLLC